MEKNKEQRLKILLADVETAPMKVWMWGMFTELTNIEFIEEDWFILCFACKWLGEKKVYSSSLPKFKNYKKDPKNDKELMLALWPYLDECDVVIAHNGRRFDIRKIYARFLYHGINPPSPFKVIDTLEAVKKEFALTSNKLDYIGKFLQIGRKRSTGGFQLWLRCMEGCAKAWKTMVTYCCGDIILLEKIYLKIRPYIIQHPNLGIYLDDNRPCCPKCSSKTIQKRGYAHTISGKYQRYQCLGCGGWSRDKKNLIMKEKSKSLITNVN